jgi:peptidoglycan/LPS O-acetylase OafA/YrhL
MRKFLRSHEPASEQRPTGIPGDRLVVTDLRYRSDIDGMRAVAILAVLCFHAGIGPFRGGFVGVDVFFVISGYLITSIIQKDISLGNFTLGAFYERRARRILPALFATISLTWVLAYFMYMPPEFKSYSASVASTSAFMSNVLFWHEGGYFAAPSEFKPLLNTGSLAVEEQFYVIFPLAMPLLTRCRKATRLLAISCVLAASLCLSVWSSFKTPGAGFYLTPTRVWELMLGALLALSDLPQLRSKMGREILGALGLTMVLWAAFWFSSGTRFPGYSALLPCIGTVLLIYSGTGQSTVMARFLSIKPLVFIGLISYSLYLFHWPLLAMARYYWIKPLSVAAATGLMFFAGVLAILSRRYIEQPFRQRSGVLPRHRLFLYAGCISLFFLGGGLTGFAKQGFPWRYPGYSHMEYRDHIPEYEERKCFLMPDQEVADWQGDQCFVSRSGRPVALVWGDSFAAHLTPGLRSNSSRIDYDVLEYATAICMPIIDEESSWRGGCRAAAEKGLMIAEKYRVSKVLLAGNWHQEAAHYRDFYGEIRKTVAALRSKGIEVAVIGQSPTFTFWDSLDAEYRLKAQHRGTANFYQYLSFEPEFIDQQSREFAGVPIVDPMRFLCQPKQCDILREGKPLYIDGGHLSVAGSTMLVRSIADELNVFGELSEKRR